MSFGFKDVGKFDSEQAAMRWAHDNNIDLRDLKTSPSSDGSVQASVRGASANDRFHDRAGDRRDGFF